jgi:hypothetical protein
MDHLRYLALDNNQSVDECALSTRTGADGAVPIADRRSIERTSTT